MKSNRNNIYLRQLSTGVRLTDYFLSHMNNGNIVTCWIAAEVFNNYEEQFKMCKVNFTSVEIFAQAERRRSYRRPQRLFML